MIERVRKLPSLPREAAPKVARAVEGELRAQIARGQSPDGKPWQPTQDGRQPLRNAATALSVRVAGNVIVATIEGVYARHHHGWVRGGVRRQILPLTTMSDSMARAVRGAVVDEFRKTMRGAP
ncbi:hypothetical protein DB32_003224 [Sandaracinus amylolyticus]|uniref:Phage virion morphogenesis protein n=2 Tax=Sandaracinus amylolyticus TaxID=927083 RepID=A0A0F6W2W7_9BACT|nr:hypothetical protein DB32_003224 [Sandaracinus amylolyticus]